MTRVEAEECFSQALKQWGKLTPEEQLFLHNMLIRFLEDRQFNIGWFDRNKLIAISIERP